MSQGLSSNPKCSHAVFITTLPCLGYLLCWRVPLVLWDHSQSEHWCARMRHYVTEMKVVSTLVVKLYPEKH